MSGRDIGPLAGLVQLTRLQLSQSGVAHAQALASLTALECLFLDRCKLAPDLAPLTALTRLAHLSLTTGQRSEVRSTRGHSSEPCRALQGLDSLPAFQVDPVLSALHGHHQLCTALRWGSPAPSLAGLASWVCAYLRRTGRQYWAVWDRWM